MLLRERAAVSETYCERRCADVNPEKEKLLTYHLDRLNLFKVINESRKEEAERERKSSPFACHIVFIIIFAHEIENLDFKECRD